MKSTISLNPPNIYLAYPFKFCLIPDRIIMFSYFVFIHVYAQHFHHHLPLFSSSIVHVQSSMSLDFAVLLKSFLHFGKTCILLQAFMHASCVKEPMFFYTICMCVKAKRMATHKIVILASALHDSHVSHEYPHYFYVESYFVLFSLSRLMHIIEFLWLCWARNR